MKESLIIYWSRRDFRLTDNPALTRAVEESRARNVPLLPLFVFEEYMTLGDPAFQFGYPSRWFLAQALPEFAKQFTGFAIVRGRAAQYFKDLSAHYELSIFVNDDVYPDFYAQVRKIEEAGIAITVLEDALTVPKETRTGEENIYSVFTPFKKAVWGSFVSAEPLPRVDLSTIRYASGEILEALPNRISSDPLALWDACSRARMLTVGGRTIDLAEYGPAPRLHGWYVTEKSARSRFDAFLEFGLLDTYNTGRDSLAGDTEVTLHGDGALEGRTSRMSLALTWGLVSARSLMEMIRTHFGEAFDNPFSMRVSQGALSYISELIWREFYRYLFFHTPALMDSEFQSKFRGTVAWTPDALAFERFTLWIKGETGYPIVDAAMKQIAGIGWMHNRARMIVSSVLTKNLGVDWRWGQEYFRAALIDLDEASNNGGWQWGASVGADPKPIRIFNPELQAKNHDVSGKYRARWNAYDEGILKAEIMPIVDQKTARAEALRRYGLSSTE